MEEDLIYGGEEFEEDLEGDVDNYFEVTDNEIQPYMYEPQEETGAAQVLPALPDQPDIGRLQNVEW